MKKFKLVLLALVIALLAFTPSFAKGFGSETPWAITIKGDYTNFSLNLEKRKLIKFKGTRGLSQVVITDNSTGITVFSGTIREGIFGPVMGLNPGGYSLRVSNANTTNRIAAGNYALSK